MKVSFFHLESFFLSSRKCDQLQMYHVLSSNSDKMAAIAIHGIVFSYLPLDLVHTSLVIERIVIS